MTHGELLMIRLSVYTELAKLVGEGLGGKYPWVDLHSGLEAMAHDANIKIMCTSKKELSKEVEW